MWSNALAFRHSLKLSCFNETSLGESHLRAVWRLSLGLGMIPATAVFAWRYNMQEPTRYKRDSMKNAKIPYKLIFKRYWKGLTAISVVWFIYDFIVYPVSCHFLLLCQDVLTCRSSISIVRPSSTSMFCHSLLYCVCTHRPIIFSQHYRRFDRAHNRFRMECCHQVPRSTAHNSFTDQQCIAACSTSLEPLVVHSLLTILALRIPWYVCETIPSLLNTFTN